MGYNLNLILLCGVGDVIYLMVLDCVLEQILVFGVLVIVVVFGLDVYEGDLFQGFKVIMDGFVRIVEWLSSLGVFVLCIQEGGYMQFSFGDNLGSFFGGL